MFIILFCLTYLISARHSIVVLWGLYKLKVFSVKSSLIFKNDSLYEQRNCI